MHVASITRSTPLFSFSHLVSSHPRLNHQFHPIPLVYRTFPPTPSSPGLSLSSISLFVSGPPSPSKSPAFVIRPVPFCTSPPSSIGISLLSPAPLAALPYVAVEPGNLLVTDVSMPDSVAVEKFVSRGCESFEEGEGQYLSHCHRGHALRLGSLDLVRLVGRGRGGLCFRILRTFWRWYLS